VPLKIIVNMLISVRYLENAITHVKVEELAKYCFRLCSYLVQVTNAHLSS